jgi:hypothetical protein
MIHLPFGLLGMQPGRDEQGQHAIGVKRERTLEGAASAAGVVGAGEFEGAAGRERAFEFGVAQAPGQGRTVAAQRVRPAIRTAEGSEREFERQLGRGVDEGSGSLDFAGVEREAHAHRVKPGSLNSAGEAFEQFAGSIGAALGFEHGDEADEGVDALGAAEADALFEDMAGAGEIAVEGERERCSGTARRVGTPRSAPLGPARGNPGAEQHHRHRERGERQRIRFEEFAGIHRAPTLNAAGYGSAPAVRRPVDRTRGRLVTQTQGSSTRVLRCLPTVKWGTRRAGIET